MRHQWKDKPDFLFIDFRSSKIQESDSKQNDFRIGSREI